MSATSTVLTRALYLRGIALVHLIALVGLWWQAEGLVGTGGILPFGHFLGVVSDQLGAEAPWRLPTVLWWWPTDTGLNVLFGVGVVLATLLLAGVAWEGWLLGGLWVVYLSLSGVFQIWLGFQWDTLLLEVTLAAMLVARWRPGNPDPPWWGWWVQWAVLGRLMFFGGLVKLTSGDPTWADGSALTYHYWTQPLPSPLSWHADRLPEVFHRASVAATFLVELVAPFLILLGRTPRAVACVAFVLLMGGLAATGNYGFFQVLCVVCCTSLLDDRTLSRVLPERLVTWVGPPDRDTRHFLAPAGAVLLALSGVQAALQLQLPVPAAVEAGFDGLRPFRSVNRYGLFAVMTTERPEIVLQGTLDGAHWRTYPFVAKPTDPGQRPVQVAPYHPRLDWQLWFAALGSCRGNPWVVRLMERLAEGSAPVLDLLAADPFDGQRPVAVRALRYDYRFAPAGGSAYWDRELRGSYCPVVQAPEDP